MALDGGMWVSKHAAKEVFKRAIENFQEKHLSNDLFKYCSTAAAQSWLDRLNLNWEGYTRQHNEIAQYFDTIEGDDTITLDDNHELELDALGVIYQRAKGLLEARLKLLNDKSRVFIPKPSDVNIPTFTGRYHEYTAFRYAVMARVNNANYPPHDKIDIVVSSLKGAARRHIGEIRGQDQQEFDRIWDALEGTYYNPYLLRRAHLAKIMDMPVISKGSEISYRDAIDTVAQQSHALSQLSVPIESAEFLVLEILLRKMDHECIESWETKRNQSEMPSLKSFLAFLEARIVILSNTLQHAERPQRTEDNRNNQKSSALRSFINHNSRIDGKHNSLKRELVSPNNASSAKRQMMNEGKSRTFSSDDRPKAPEKCIMNCNFARPHHLWICKKFRALDLTAREKLIDNNRLCRRCITLKHPLDQCKSPKCDDCTDDIHNAMLCPKFMVLAKTNLALQSGGGNTRKSFRSHK